MNFYILNIIPFHMCVGANVSFSDIISCFWDNDRKISTNFNWISVNIFQLTSCEATVFCTANIFALFCFFLRACKTIIQFCCPPLLLDFQDASAFPLH